MEKKRVLFLISSLNTGGAQSAMANLSIALSALYDIDWLLNSDEKKAYDYYGNIISLGISEPENRNDLSYQGKAFFKRLSMLKKLKKSGKYIATISFLESANIANILTRKHGTKTIISQRNTITNRRLGLKGKLLVKVDKTLYKKADEMVAISEGVRKELLAKMDLNPYKTTTILNGYNIKAIRDGMDEEPSDFEKEEGAFTFITMGRLHDQKGQWHLIRAFSKVYESEKRARLLIIGSGNEEGYLTSLIDGYGLQNAIKIMPYRKNPFSVMGRCDAFVFPSRYEGFGNVLPEALICGLPVIATDYRSGAREILAPDTDVDIEVKDSIDYAEYGMIVPVCSGERYDADSPLEEQEELLAKAMLSIMSDKNLYLTYQEKANERAKQLSFENKAKEWKTIIER